jgi:hypothetical protein
MQALVFLSSDTSLRKKIPKWHHLWVEGFYTRCDRGKKANADSGIKVLYNKSQSVILFQGDDQLNTELQEFEDIFKVIMRPKSGNWQLRQGRSTATYKCEVNTTTFF